MRKYIAAFFWVAATILGAYSAATLYAAGGFAVSVPTRYRAFDSMTNPHDSYYRERLMGVFEISASDGSRFVEIGNLNIPLPRSKFLGWMMAIFAVILVVVSLCLFGRAATGSRNMVDASVDEQTVAPKPPTGAF